MAIERIGAGGALPPITQRLDISNATVLEPGRIPPLAPISRFMAPMPDAGAAAPVAQLAQAGTSGSGATAAAPGPDPTQRDSSAMQANQVFFSRQLVWQAPNPRVLANSWRVMLKTYGEQRAALQEQAAGQHVPGNLLMTEQNPMLLRESPRAPLMMEADAWRFAVYGWDGQRMMLRVLANDADDTPAAAKRRRGKIALRLELVLPGAGRVVIQMEPVLAGIVLDLAAGDEASLALLRRMLPAIGEVVKKSGLRVMHCRIGKELHAAPAPNNYPMQSAAASLTLPIFRAMAEVAVLLSRPGAQEALAPQAPEPEAQTWAPPAPPSPLPELPRAVPAPRLEDLDFAQPSGDWKWET